MIAKTTNDCVQDILALKTHAIKEKLKAVKAVSRGCSTIQVKLQSP